MTDATGRGVKMNSFGKERVYKDGISCGHPGCLNHVSHPCEKCGRVGGVTGKEPDRQGRVDQGSETSETSAILRQAHAELWAFREKMGEGWPKPDVLDSLRFAVTEAAEALEAQEEKELNEAMAIFEKYTESSSPSLQGAIIDAGKALDAWMRANRPQFARNRNRLGYDEAVLDELADTAMMLLSATPSHVTVDVSTFPPEAGNTMSQIVRDVSEALWLLEAYGMEPYEGRYPVLSIVRNIAAFPGMDLLPRLRGRYARIWRKHAPTADGVHPAVMPKVLLRGAEAYRAMGVDYVALDDLIEEHDADSVRSTDGSNSPS